MSISKPGSKNIALIILLVCTAAFTLFLATVVIWPAYQKPSNRTYDTKFGYAALRRKLDLPFPVETAPAQLRKIIVQQLGEGRITAMPIRVPIVPTDKIVSVAVAEGELVKKGQLLAELDTTRARLRVESVKLLVESAQAELERVKLGSAYTLSQERPEREGINLEASKKQIDILKERHDSMLKLFKQGSASRVQLLEVESKLAEAERDLQNSQLGVDVSSKGQPQSAAIAENNLKQQQNLYAQSQRELDDYHVRAPTDGVLESVLVHAGEYNQKPGEVGFVIAAGLWFEAHIDQAGIHKVSVGGKARVHLEALPGEVIDGTISRIVPIVTYSSSGPEANRPIRSLGTGSPEWPTTFSVIIEFSPKDSQRLVPGLTGFAKIEAERQALAVPVSAVTSLLANQGVVTILANGTRTTKRVTLGDSWEGWVEIKEGLSAQETVAIAGHEDLQPEDKLKETRSASQ